MADPVDFYAQYQRSIEDASYYATAHRSVNWLEGDLGLGENEIWDIALPEIGQALNTELQALSPTPDEQGVVDAASVHLRRAHIAATSISHGSRLYQLLSTAPDSPLKEALARQVDARERMTPSGFDLEGGEKGIYDASLAKLGPIAQKVEDFVKVELSRFDPNQPPSAGLNEFDMEDLVLEHHALGADARRELEAGWDFARNLWGGNGRPRELYNVLRAPASSNSSFGERFADYLETQENADVAQAWRDHLAAAVRAGSSASAGAGSPADAERAATEREHAEWLQRTAARINAGGPAGRRGQIEERLKAVEGEMVADPPRVGVLKRPAKPEKIRGLAEDVVSQELKDHSLYLKAREAEEAMLGAGRFNTEISSRLEAGGGLPDFADFTARGGLAPEDGRDAVRGLLNEYLQMHRQGYKPIVSRLPADHDFHKQLGEVLGLIINEMPSQSLYDERHIVHQMRILLEDYAKQCAKHNYTDCSDFRKFAAEHYPVKDSPLERLKNRLNPSREPIGPKIKEALVKKYGTARQIAGKARDSIEEHSGVAIGATAVAGATALIGGLALARGDAEEDRQEHAQAVANGRQPPQERSGITFAKCMVGLGAVTLIAAIGLGIRHMLQGGGLGRG